MFFFVTKYSVAVSSNPIWFCRDKYKLPKELETAQVNALTPLTFFQTLKDCGVSVNGQCYGFVIVDSDIIMVARGALNLFYLCN